MNAALIVSIIFALIIIGIGIAILVLICQSPPGEMTSSQDQGSSSCSKDADCNLQKVCKGRLGCCARCHKNGTCVAGQLVSGGRCAEVSNSSAGQQAAGERSKKSGAIDKHDSQRKTVEVPFAESMSFAQANMPPTEASSGNANLSITGCPSMASMPADRDDSFCMAKLCGPNGAATARVPGACCAVSQHGTCTPGVVSPSGACQTQVQQDAWANFGAAMPNTYMISTSGPKIGATMGGCKVAPINSSIQNFVGFFDSCAPKAAEPMFGREYQSDLAPQNFGSCG